MRTALPLVLLLAGCPGPEDPNVVQTDVELPVDCFQGDLYPDSDWFTVSATSPAQFAIGGSFTTDGSRTTQRFEDNDDFAVPPVARQLPDGTPHFVWNEGGDLLVREAAIWWLSDEGILYRSDDDGQSWVGLPPEVPNLDPSYDTLGFDAMGEQLVLWSEGIEDSVFFSPDGGVSWRNVAMPVQPNLAIEVSDAVVDGNGRILVSTDNNNGPQLWLSEDEGVTFEEITADAPTKGLVGGWQLTLTEDGRVWMLDYISQDGASGHVFHFSDDWLTWTSGTLVLPGLTSLDSSLPDTVTLESPFAPYTPIVPQPGNRLAWGASISGSGADAFADELPFNGQIFCVLGDDTTGTVTPEYPVVSPSDIGPGTIAPMRRYGTAAPGVAGAGQAWFVVENTVQTDGGVLFRDAQYFYAGSDIFRDPGSGDLFVLLHPDEVFARPNDDQVPVIVKVDAETGDRLDEQLVGPFVPPVGSDEWAWPVKELKPSGGETWPFVHVLDENYISNGLYRPDSPLDQPPLYDIGGQRFNFDPDTGHLWIRKDQWLHRTNGASSWESSCDQTAPTEDCIPAGGVDIWIHGGFIYQSGSGYIDRWQIGTSTEWERVVEGPLGVADIWFEDRSDGLVELWFLDNGTLWVAVPDGSGALQQSW